MMTLSLRSDLNDNDSLTLDEVWTMMTIDSITVSKRWWQLNFRRGLNDDGSKLYNWVQLMMNLYLLLGLNDDETLTYDQVYLMMTV